MKILKHLIESFGEIAKISKESEQAFFSVVTRKEVGKKKLLQQEGYQCNNIYFIEKGIARTFYYKDGKDITYWIALEGEFVGQWQVFFQEPLATSSLKL